MSFTDAKRRPYNKILRNTSSKIPMASSKITQKLLFLKRYTTKMLAMQYSKYSLWNNLCEKKEMINTHTTIHTLRTLTNIYTRFAVSTLYIGNKTICI